MSAIDELAKINLDELTPLQAAVCFLYKSHPEDATKAAEELARLQAIAEAAEKIYESLLDEKGLLKAIQWNRESHGWLACPACHELKKDGHAKNCDLIAFINNTSTLAAYEKAVKG